MTRGAPTQQYTLSLSMLIITSEDEATHLFISVCFSGAPLQWFASIDKDRNGVLSVAELQAALAAGGMNFSMSMVASIIRCARDGNFCNPWSSESSEGVRGWQLCTGHASSSHQAW